MMKIYGDENSGNCLKVKYTADFLGLAYQWVAVDLLKDETRTPEFLSMSLMGQVPLVEFSKDRYLAQSNAIIRYLAKGSALIPTDPFTEAKADELMFWEQYSHEPYVAVCRFQMLYLNRPKEEREDVRVARGEAALDFMEYRIEGREWFVGDRFSIADIALLPYTRFAEQGGFDLSRRPHVENWISRCEKTLGLPPVH